jgi:hypothetical protein
MVSLHYGTKKLISKCSLRIKSIRSGYWTRIWHLSFFTWKKPSLMLRLHCNTGFDVMLKFISHVTKGMVNQTLNPKSVFNLVIYSVFHLISCRGLLPYVQILLPKIQTSIALRKKGEISRLNSLEYILEYVCVIFFLLSPPPQYTCRENGGAIFVSFCLSLARTVKRIDLSSHCMTDITNSRKEYFTFWQCPFPILLRSKSFGFGLLLALIVPFRRVSENINRCFELWRVLTTVVIRDRQLGCEGDLE